MKNSQVELDFLQGKDCALELIDGIVVVAVVVELRAPSLEDL